MVPGAYHDYFFACSGAAGAFVGLLFVAISVAPEKTVHDGAPVERRMTAVNAFSALVNGIAVLVLEFFALGITRAWQLLGGRALLFSGRIANRFARGEEHPPEEP